MGGKHVLAFLFLLVLSTAGGKAALRQVAPFLLIYPFLSDSAVITVINCPALRDAARVLFPLSNQMWEQRILAKSCF